MPACEVTDVDVQIWNALDSGVYACSATLKRKCIHCVLVSAFRASAIRQVPHNLITA
jgi:hypothetical protein